MGRKSLSVPSLAHMRHSSSTTTTTLRSTTSEWWEGVRGGVRTSVRYIGEKIPQRFADQLPSTTSKKSTDDDVERLHRKLSLVSLTSKEDLKVCESPLAPSQLHPPQPSHLPNFSSSFSPQDADLSSRQRPPTTAFGDMPLLSRFTRAKSAERRAADDCRLRDRLSLMLPKTYGTLETTMKSVKKDLGKLRSKSCDRILKRRSKSGRASPPVLAVAAAAANAAAAELDEEYFQINSTLRRSRRLAEKKRKRYTGPFVGLARAKVDCTPSPYDTEALPYKAGDLIQIICRRPSGIWSGECGGRTGTFKFINVQEMEEMPRTQDQVQECTVVGLLCRLDLAHLTSKLVLNGWDTLRKLGKMSRQDLVYLGVEDKAEQDRLLTAVTVLQDLHTSLPATADQLDTSSADGRIHSRSLDRMDSGYYDIRDSDSDSSLPKFSSSSAASSPTASSTTSSVPSTSTPLPSSSSSPRLRYCDKPVVLRKTTSASSAVVAVAGGGGGGKDRCELTGGNSLRLLDAAAELTAEAAATSRSKKAAMLAAVESARKRFDSINESRLSLAEPNPILNKSF